MPDTQATPTTADLPELFVLDISYFSGKLEAYFRYQNIEHERTSATWSQMNHEILDGTGLMKVPAIRLSDGSWLADSTPIIEAIERHDVHLESHGLHSVERVFSAKEPLNFIMRLLEDYADEWLWRPALYYRWAFAEDRSKLLDIFADSFLPQWMPRAAIKTYTGWRQYKTYVARDGVTEKNKAWIEKIYTDHLHWLTLILQERQFLFGDRPSFVDFGFFASMFRHFSHDPTPARIMQKEAPLVQAWVDRMWNAQASDFAGTQFISMYDLTGPGYTELLTSFCNIYLPYLLSNAQAFAQGQRRTDIMVDYQNLQDIPVVQYRVWCLERLQSLFREMLPAQQSDVSQFLTPWAIDVLGGYPIIDSNLYPHTTPPYCAPEPVGALSRMKLFMTGTDWNKPKN